VDDPERARELAFDVGEHRVRQLAEFRVLPAPRQVDVVGFRAHAEHLCLPRHELVVSSSELGDLGGDRQT